MDTNGDDWEPLSPRSKQRRMLKRSKPRKSPGEKLSFQEAAIHVLSDQKNKGVFALTTRRIWDLIQEAGLVDTKFVLKFL
jgi:hypothetical protein